MFLSISAPISATRSNTSTSANPRGEVRNAQVSGPSDLHSPAHAESNSTPPARTQPGTSHPFSGTACGSRSTRPTGVR
jgi:hypothetical protein